MSTILAYVDLTLAGYFAVFIATLVFSQKIKDWFAGVPSELRSGMKSLEAKAKADLQLAVNGVIAKYTPAPTPVPTRDPSAPVPPAA